MKHRPHSQRSVNVAAVAAQGNPDMAVIIRLGTPFQGTTYTLTGPTSGLVGVASDNFLVTPNAPCVVNITIQVTYNGSSVGISPIVLSWNGTNETQTFTITPPYAQTFDLTPTNDANLIDPTVLHYIALNGIAIDSTWLANPANKGLLGSYKLSQGATLYQLAQNVTFDHTGFVVGADDVTLDLNGHTLTFSNAAPLSVSNPSFEGNNTTGWDLSGCTPGVASVVPIDATYFMDGSYALKLTGITTQQVILSPIINIPNTGIEYAAHLKPRCHSSSTIIYIDAVDTSGNLITRVADDSENTVGSGTSPDAHSGYEAVVYFPSDPTVTPLPSQIRIRLTIVPVVTGDDFWIDALAVEQSRDMGVIFTSSSGGIPKQLGTISTGHYRFTLKNGTISQGQSGCWQCNPCHFRSGRGFTVDNVIFNWSGGNTRTIEGKYSSQTINVTNCTFNGNMTRIVSRKTVYAAVYLNSSTGSVNVSNNTITGAMHVGIEVEATTASGYTSLLINDNVITHSSLFTDCYAIWLGPGVSNFEVARNNINSQARGIVQGGNTNKSIGPGSYHDNYVVCQEKANREYTDVGMEATAFRLRNYGSTIHDVHIYNNTFIAINPGTSDGVWDWCAVGARISNYPPTGTPPSGNNLFENNTCKAIVQALDSTLTGNYSSSAWALSIPAAAIDGGGWTFKDNVLESNHVSLHIGDNDSDNYHIYGMLFWGNTSHLSADSPGIKTYVPWMIGDWGDWTDPLGSVHVISQKDDNGNTPAITWKAAATEGVSTGFTLTIIVKDGSSVPQSGATVTVIDNTSTVTNTGTTDISGTVILPVVSTYYNQPGTNPAIVNSTSKTPHTIDATSGILTGSQSVSVTADATINITVS